MYFATSPQARLELGFGNYSCNWGVHICGLYETEADRDQIVLNFCAAGVEKNDLQVYCPTERSLDDFIERYKEHFPAHAARLGDPHTFRFFDEQSLYYPAGRFSPELMKQNLSTFYEGVQEHGPCNIRAVAEMSWALKSVPGRELLMSYESQFNAFVPNKRWVSICLYNVSKFSGDVIMDVLHTHPYAINHGVMTENPFYETPDRWLARHAAQPSQT